jgi:signal transduction histidine kinase/ActR/RegA family two-component response regulator
MSTPLLKVEIRYEQDLILARRRARQIAQQLGFAAQDQVRIATALSELVRNVFQYTPGGRVEFAVETTPPQAMVMRVTDRGQGIGNLDEILSGRYVSKTGMGVGLSGARRLVDGFDIETGSAGTTITLCCELPKRAPVDARDISARIAEGLAAEAPQNPFEEMQRQNQELLAALAEVQRQQVVLSQLNLELEATNRGVVALSSELEQRADYQKRASELKTEFLSTITHELRTPLNSIISISSILIDRLDGELTDEQEKQIGFIRNSARELSSMVNDVLDLAKVEAGKVVIRPLRFEIAEMFRVLRGMLKPLLQADNAVELSFADWTDNAPLISDEGKVSQILRNFISNALKYTLKGRIEVSARAIDADWFEFAVTDTGIGIATEDQGRIFDDFTQIEGDHQMRIQGTGLGLPLSRRLAEMLGGQVVVKSTLGKGSTFALILPSRYQGPEVAEFRAPRVETTGVSHDSILLIDDHTPDRYILRKAIERYSDAIIEAFDGASGLRAALTAQPVAIFLDLGLPDISGEEILKELKRLPETRDIPVIVNSSKSLTEAETVTLLADATAVLSKALSHPERLRRIAEIFRQIEATKKAQADV